MNCARPSRSGFGITEVLVALALASVALACLVIFLRQIRDDDARKQAFNNFKTVGLAAHAYNDQHKRLPKALQLAPGESIAGGPLRSLGAFYQRDPSVLILPTDWSYHSDQGAWATKDGVWTSIGCNYSLFGRPDGIAVDTGFTPLAINTIRRGTSNTIMTATLHSTCPADAAAPTTHIDAGPMSAAGAFFGRPNAVGWAVPTRRSPCGPDNGGDANGRAAAYEARGILVGLADGTARTITGNGRNQVWNAALDPAGFEYEAD